MNAAHMHKPMRRLVRRLARATIEVMVAKTLNKDDYTMAGLRKHRNNLQNELRRWWSGSDLVEKVAEHPEQYI